jgi:hypothetical protein
MQRLLRVSAWLAAVADYTSVLLKNPPMLRATIGLDNFFIVFYTNVFITFGSIVLRLGAQRALVFGFLGFALMLAVLDMVENLHFYLGIFHLGPAVPRQSLGLRAAANRHPHLCHASGNRAPARVRPPGVLRGGAAALGGDVPFQ